ncbi:hypothetical protein GCM10027277_15470 [Pseudoduganella ginsengisoli]
MDARDASQIAAVLAVRAPLARGFMQPRERQRSRPLIAQISSTAERGRQRWAIPPLELVTHNATSFGLKPVPYE